MAFWWFSAVQQAMAKSWNRIPALKILCNDDGCCQSMTNVCFECTHNHNASPEPDHSIMPMQYIPQCLQRAAIYHKPNCRQNPGRLTGKMKLHQRPVTVCWLKQRWLSWPLSRLSGEDSGLPPLSPRSLGSDWSENECGKQPDNWPPAHTIDFRRVVF